MKKLLTLGAVLLLAASTALAATTTGTLSVTVGPEMSVSVTATTTLTEGGAPFTPYTGTTTVTYSARTTKTGGDGNITLEVTTDFGATPKAPSAAANNLTYTCTGAGPGTPCATAQTASTTATTPVLSTIGADGHANAATVALAWSLANNVAYQTGTYTATVTYTYSAT
jgi:hypothetical protein